jgi:exodeoxyribonuclease V
MQLNPDQEAAAQAFYNFLFTDQKEFSISGPAGTGKTFLMQHLLTQTLQEYKNTCKLLDLPWNIYTPFLTATTNKAAEVLSQATGRFATTIHSHLNLTVETDFGTGRTKAVKTNSFYIHGKELIVVDEASMINDQLYQLINLGTDNSCKILYLGDHCQMAPVFETISPIYRNPKKSIYLTQPMRNAGQPALMALCDQLRQTVETGIFHPIQEFPGVIDYLSEAQAKAYLDAGFQRLNPNRRVLCYTNKKVNLYNQHIRDIRNMSPMFVVGEEVINNSALKTPQRMIQTDEALQVVSVDSTIRTHQIDPADPNSHLDVYQVTVLDKSMNQHSFSCPVDPARIHQLKNYYRSQKRWNLVYQIENSYPDLRQRDASTVYKAQGSTFDEVFLDLTDIGSSTQNDQIARMLYVGASRATTRLVLFGKLPNRLFKAAA